MFKFNAAKVAVKRKKKPMKGTAGEGTGAATRAAIASKDKDLTDEEIGKAVNRSGSVISQIRSGTIFNPPADLAGRIRAIKVPKKS